MDDEALKKNIEECEKLVEENVVLRHEMKSIAMKLTKEIEARKKNEENLTQSLNDRSDECYIINCDNDQLKLKLL